MRYLYKINSAYDGFSPRRIPDRLLDGRFLKLGWRKYLDAVNLHDEVWVVFTGKGFEKGVYIQGLVAKINADASEVQVRVRRLSTTCPLTDAATSASMLTAVGAPGRQVFLWPSDRELRERCNAADCGQRQCLDCDVWTGMPQIDATHYRPPAPLRGLSVVPAYWIIPPRCFLYYNSRQPAPWNRQATDRFGAFKVGEQRYAYPFAAGISEALRARGEAEFDAIVPIPLSPEKATAGELDRTAALARELSALTGARVRNYLSLSCSISKRRMQTQGFTLTQFKERYRELLQVSNLVANLSRVILLDDVITTGSTLSVASSAIRRVNPEIEIVVAAAGQMIVTAVVVDQNGPAW